MQKTNANAYNGNI